jgi:hypothetical protein
MGELGKFMDILVRRFGAHAIHAVLHNVPEGRTKPEDVPAQTMKRGLVSAIGEYLEWDIDAAGQMCVDVLEDVNAHTWADVMRSVIENDNSLTT